MVRRPNAVEKLLGNGHACLVVTVRRNFSARLDLGIPRFSEVMGQHREHQVELLVACRFLPFRLLGEGVATMTGMNESIPLGMMTRVLLNSDKVFDFPKMRQPTALQEEQ